MVFWSNMNCVVKCVPCSYRLIVLGDLNGRLGVCQKLVLCGSLVWKVNVNERKLLDMCRYICVREICTLGINLCICIRGIERVRIWMCVNMNILCAGTKDMLSWVNDVIALGGLSEWLSDHIIAWYKIICELYQEKMEVIEKELERLWEQK